MFPDLPHCFLLFRFVYYTEYKPKNKNKWVEAGGLGTRLGKDLHDRLKETQDTKEEAKTAPSGELDDLEFWLSRTDASTSSKTKEQPPAAAGETKPQAEATAEGEEGETKWKKKREKVGVSTISTYCVVLSPDQIVCICPVALS